MIAFLPIARYRIQYQLASGRPFSSFERLLLRAIHQGEKNLSTLAHKFGVHRRLVIEGLVTLMQAGWVSLGSGDSEFVLSPRGERACDGSEGLPPTIIVSDRQQTIVVEKVTGQVARSNEIDFHSRSKLRNLWNSGVALGRRDVSNVIDPGLVSPFLPHQPTEWIRWIGPISVLSDNAAFVVVDVDTASNRITGTPKSWEARLLPECIEQVIRREREIADAGGLVDDEDLRQFVRGIGNIPDEDILDGESDWSALTLGNGDVLRSCEQHDVAFGELLRNAITYAGIVCPTLSFAGVDKLPPLVTEALSRGVLVNIFFGEMPKKEVADGWRAFEVLKKIEYDSGRGKSPGRLVLGMRATECSTSILLADNSDGAAATMGGFAWTGSGPESGPKAMSLRLRDPWVVARLCEILGGFSAADEKFRLGAGFVRLKKAAGELRHRAQAELKPAAGRQEARLILDRDHQQAIFAAVSGARREISVFTDDLALFSRSGWLHLLEEPAERLGKNLRVLYGSPEHVEAGKIPRLETLIKSGVTLEYAGGLSANLILADDDHVVLLGGGRDSALLGGRQLYSTRIGMAIRGAQIVSCFKEGT